MTQISKAMQRFELKPMHEHCILATDMINMEQARLMYNKLYDDCLTEGLPLTKLTDLAANESCIPETHPETETIIDTISHAIMRHLMCLIPKTNSKMLEILGPYTKEACSEYNWVFYNVSIEVRVKRVTMPTARYLATRKILKIQNILKN
jgi:hypothetical protein